MAVWFWRNHNFIATELAKVNPCWSDEKLFNTARDINIALFIQINYYELMPIFLGKIFKVYKVKLDKRKHNFWMFLSNG